MYEMEALIVKHLKDTTGREWAIEIILAQPRYKRVWAWWRALAYYQINHNYERLEDVPEGTERFKVMQESVVHYRRVNGKCEVVQTIGFKECKSFYGD